MALPFEIQIGRISRFLSKWASTKGSSPRVTLGSEIVPVLSMWSGAENRFLDSWVIYGTQINVAAVAANGGAVQFRNPGNSGVVAVFTKIQIAAVATDAYHFSIGPATTDLPTSGILTGARLDARFGATQTPTLIVSAQSSVAGVVADLAALVATMRILANTSQDIIVTDLQEVPLLPGDALRIAAQTINEQLTTNWMWRERSLEESERQ